MRNAKLYCSMGVILLAWAGLGAGATLYVNTDGSGGAYTSIQTAIDDAVSGVDQIEVAPGTYDESIRFWGQAVRLYSSGGASVTTIDGNGSDHVVQCRNGEGPGTVLEGLTVTGGNAVGPWPENIGGGMFNLNSSPTVINCIFKGNTATNGGGMLNRGGSPTITGCTFEGNSVGDLGGGMQNTQSSPIVTDCTFIGNTASHAGGMGNTEDCSPTVINCTFIGNTATAQGGGMTIYGGSVTVTGCTFNGNIAPDGGGMVSSEASLTVINCKFAGNSATTQGGGMANWDSSATVTGCTFILNSAGNWGGAITNDGSQTMILDNCTFTSNSAGRNGGALSNWGSNLSARNCILWADMPSEITGNDPTITFCDIQGEDWPGAGNINADPMFADAGGRLSWNSPCIEAGDNSSVTIATDLDGNPRIQGASVDMGAYEYVWDADADGIEDSVDAAPGVYSDALVEGSTSGVIVDRGQQTLIVMDAPAPLGVRVRASASGGAIPAQVSVCSAAVFTLDAGDAVDVTCGSVDIAVVEGTIQITFVASDGTRLETNLNKGNSITFEPETGTVNAPTTNTDDVVIVVDNQQYTVAPGESKWLGTPKTIGVDIYPNRTPNRVILNRNYTLYVAVLGSDTFDVTTLDSATVKFGRSGSEASPVRAPVTRDLNGDGFVDAMYGFMTSDCDFQLGDTEGWLTGFTSDGIPVEGVDSVLVSP